MIESGPAAVYEAILGRKSRGAIWRESDPRSMKPTRRALAAFCPAHASDDN